MTVSSTTNRSGPYAGNGVTTNFEYQFRILDAAHVSVILTEDGVDTVVDPSDYTVTGVGSADGGDVVFAVAPATGQAITLIRNAAFTQEVDLENQGAFFAEVIEEALDLAAMRDQQLQEQVDRAVRIPVGADASTLDSLISDVIRLSGSADEIDAVAGISDDVTTVAGLTAEISALPGQLSAAQTAASDAETALADFETKYLGAKTSAPSLDNEGNALIVGATYWDIGSDQMFTWSGAEWLPTFLTGNVVRNLTTATAGQTVVTVPTYIVGANTISVFLNGLRVILGEDYVETDQNTITFTSGLADGDEVEAIVLQPYAIGTTGAESITTTYGVTLARLLELKEGTVADLLADTTLNPASLPVGSVIEAGGFRFEVLPPHVTGVYQTDGGVQLRRQRLLADPVPAGRAKLALIFDDGYKNNVTKALPVLKKYGFAATIAVEVERINRNYNNDPNMPVVTAEDMREWIKAGGEIGNHPNLNQSGTEAEMAADAVAENEKLRDILTGALVWNGSAFVAGPVTHPELLDFRVDSAVYRGGGRNDTSDRAYYTVFDKVRGINGPVSTRGDGIYVTDAEGELPMFWSARSIDPSGDDAAFRGMLDFVRSLAGSETTGVIYAHFTPDADPTFAGAPPWITIPQLDDLCRICLENGIEIVPFNRIGACNLIPQDAFADDNGFTFNASQSGDAAEFDVSDALNSLPRSVVLTAAAARTGGNRPRMETRILVVRPFTRYRIRVRYKIETELNRGGANPNHGLQVVFSTTSADSPGSADVSVDSYQLTAPTPLPFEVTSGWATYETTLFTGLGFLGRAIINLNNCVGTVRIGHISVEKLDSFSRRPLTLVNTYNGVLARRVSLPNPPNTGSRKWRWKVDLESQPVISSPGQTVNLAAADSADVSPSEGQTVYVLGRGLGDFASRGGQIGTFSSGSWGGWTTPANNTLIRAQNSGEGFAEARYWHHRRIAATGGQFTRLFTRAFEDRAFVQRVSGANFDVWSSTARTDEFRVVCTPVLE